jgi:hypothetical protein
MIGGPCQVGGRFSRCTGVSIESCQYCGRDFCRLHAHYVRDHDAVCNRKPCVEKWDDLAAHTVYKAHVASRNGAGLCGMDGCGPHPRSECSLCRGHFCSDHLRPRMYPMFNGYSTVDRPVSVCQRCWDRRKLWRH